MDHDLTSHTKPATRREKSSLTWQVRRWELLTGVRSCFVLDTETGCPARVRRSEGPGMAHYFAVS